MTSNKRRLMRTLITANGGCGCSKPKPSDVHDPTPKPKNSIYQDTNPSSLTPSTTTSGDDEDFTSTTIAEADTTRHDHNNATKYHTIPKPSTKLVDSVAIEKDSKDPHEDFRHSMFQMILEREIYSETDLQELLECFLLLNAPCHHQVIVQAFMEICEETFPKKLHAAAAAGKASRRNNQIIIGKGR